MCVCVCVFLSRALTYTYMWTHFFKYVQFLICKLTDTVSPGRFTATERVQVYVFRSKWRLLQHGRMAFEQAASLLPTVSAWGSGAVKRREGETAIYFIDTSPFFAGLMSKKYMFCQVGFYVCHRPGLFSLEIVPFLGGHQGLPVLRVCSPIVLQITTMMPTSRNINPFANGRRKHKCRMHAYDITYIFIISIISIIITIIIFFLLFLLLLLLYIRYWLVVYLPLWKMMEFVSWEYYSQLNVIQNSMVPVTTNQWFIITGTVTTQFFGLSLHRPRQDTSKHWNWKTTPSRPGSDPAGLGMAESSVFCRSDS